jgi:hypothetical protein
LIGAVEWAGYDILEDGSTLLNKSEHWQGICKGPRSLESGPFCSAKIGY